MGERSRCLCSLRRPSTPSWPTTPTDCEIPGMQIELRPPEFMPAPYDFRDPTDVNTLFEL